MKKALLVLTILVSGSIFMTAQTTPATTTTASTTAIAKAKKKHKHAKTAAAMYQCPMKCEAPNKVAGKCPKCGMEKVKA